MSRASTDELPAGRGERAGHTGGVPTGAVLSRTTLMTVRRVLHAYRDGWLLEGRLATAARMAAEDARQLGVAAERMLVTLERAWAGLDDVRRLSALDTQDLLRRLVTLTIDAYYASYDQPDRATRLPGPPAETDRHAGARTAA
jgi:hypothetical protein